MNCVLDIINYFCVAFLNRIAFLPYEYTHMMGVVKMTPSYDFLPKCTKN